MSFTFKHPKYYTELRKRNKLDQAISKEPATAGNQRSPGPGLKQQAPSSKPQASAGAKPQAASSKPCGARVKPQAASVKLLD